MSRCILAEEVSAGTTSAQWAFLESCFRKTGFFLVLFLMSAMTRQQELHTTLPGLHPFDQREAGRPNSGPTATLVPKHARICRLSTPDYFQTNHCPTDLCASRYFIGSISIDETYRVSVQGLRFSLPFPSHPSKRAVA